MAFDITSVLKNVPNPDTETEQIEYIDLDLIDPDPDNFYSLEGLDDLAANIELIGLQQPLRVRTGEAGHVIVVSGHRRRAACLMLRDGGNEKFRRVACIREQGEVSEAMRELRLIYANASTRVMGAAELSKQAERVEMLLYKLKEEGTEFPGRMRDHVAQACQVSKSKLSRLHAIRSNMDPMLLEHFDKGEINESAAYELQKLPKVGQAAIAESVKRTGDAYFINGDAAEYCVKHAERFMQPCKCGDGEDCNHHERRFVAALRAQYSWARCSGGCCLSCGDLDRCGQCCAKGLEKKKTAKADRAAEEARLKKESEKHEAKKQAERKASRQKNAQRILPLINAAGLSDKTELPNQSSWLPGMKVAQIRKWAAGKFGDAYFSDSEFIPTGGQALKTWAQRLSCSTDFLLGLTDEPRPGSAPAWSTGYPTEKGFYTVRIGLGKEESPRTARFATMEWDGSQFITIGTGVPARAGETVFRWFKLPEV